MLQLIRFWVWFCCLKLSRVVAGDIDEDYYYGNPLRSLNNYGCNPVKKLYCYHKCKEYEATCFSEKCFCIYEPDIYKDLPEFKVLKETTPIQDLDYPVRVEVPKLRHHIAHFCPNLEEARKCIRKCMKVGKPAFCGKDHACYCGQKYYNQKQEKPDPAKINAGFYDLYVKYFGPDTSGMATNIVSRNIEPPIEVIL